jgi:predicted RNA methylase
MGLSLVAGSVGAAHHAFEFRNEVKQGEQRPGFTNKVMVRTATFTVGAVAIKDEIKPHRHHDGAHVLDVCCGTGASALPAAQAVGPEGKVIAVDLAGELLKL